MCNLPEENLGLIIKHPREDTILDCWGCGMSTWKLSSDDSPGDKMRRPHRPTFKKQQLWVLGVHGLMSSRHLFFRPTTTDVHRDVRKSDAGADMVFMCLDRTRLRTLPTWIPYGFFRPMNNPICIVPYLEIAMFNIDMQKKLFAEKTVSR